MIATRDHFGNVLVELSDRFPKTVVVNCDLGLATRTLDFKKKHPDRFIECGIAEANAISIGAGMAQEGFRPLVASFGHFLTGKFLEIFQSVGLNRSGVVLVGTHAGLAIGKDGPTQMGLRDLALMRLIEGLEIIHPADGVETQKALEYILGNQRPTYLRLCRQPTPEVHAKDYAFVFGKPDLLIEGKRLLLIAQGGTVYPCLEAARSRNAAGDSVGVLNVSSLPFSEPDLIAIVSQYERVVVVEDHYIKGGIAEEIASCFARRSVSMPFRQIAVTDYAQSASPESLYRKYGLDAEGIAKVCQDFQ